MRIKRSVLLAFLLVLYIGPSLFIMTYGPSAIPAQQNMNKEFSLSTEYETSDQSITYFNETLPDDVMLGMERDSVLDQYRLDELSLFDDCSLASRWTNGGKYTGGVTDSITSNTTTLTINAQLDSATEAVYFDISAEDIEIMGTHLLVSFLWEDNVTDAYTGVIEFFAYSQEGQSFETYFDALSYSESVVHTIDIGPVTWSAYFELGDTRHLYDRLEIRLYATVAINFSLYVNYVMLGNPDLVYEDTHYAESFANVSDWGIHTGNTITTDGDVATFTTEGDNAYNIYYCNTPSQSFENYYLEFRYSVNDTDFDKLGISLKSEDSYLGDIIYSLGFGHTTTDYETHKFLINGSGVVESVSYTHLTLPTTPYV